MPKPRLFREGGMWACWGGIFCGHGSSPAIAYIRWRTVYRLAHALHGAG